MGFRYPSRLNAASCWRVSVLAFSSFAGWKRNSRSTLPISSVVGMNFGVCVGSISLYSIQVRELGNVRAPTAKVPVIPQDHAEVEQSSFDPRQTHGARIPFLERPRVRHAIATLLAVTFF